MKKNIICAMFLVIAATSFCQQTEPSHPLTREDYLVKSKHQKTAAWILIGGGTVLIGAGFLIGNREESSFDDAATGAIIGGIGFLAALGSIPLFIASGKNKRRGMSVSIKNETTPQLFNGNPISRSVPSVSFKIGL